MDVIRAVIFDWGGVLIDDPADGLARYCADALGVSVEEYKKAYRLFEADFRGGESVKIFSGRKSAPNWVSINRSSTRCGDKPLPLCISRKMRCLNWQAAYKKMV